MISFLRFPTLILTCIFSAWASSYTLYSISNKATLTADHVRAFDVAVGGGALADRAGNIYLTGPAHQPVEYQLPLLQAARTAHFCRLPDKDRVSFPPGTACRQCLRDLSMPLRKPWIPAGTSTLREGPTDFTGTSIYRVTPDGMISIYLVTPTSWTNIFGMAADADGNLYVPRWVEHFRNHLRVCCENRARSHHDHR